MTRSVAIAGYSALKSAKMVKMDGAGKAALLIALFALKKEAEDYDAFQKDTLDRMLKEYPKSKRLKELESKTDRTTEETAEYAKLNNEFYKQYVPVVEKKLKEESDAKYDRLTDAQFADILASNEDWTADIALAAKEAIA